MVRNKFTPEQKIQIMLESIKTNISTAELCRKHNIHPQTFQDWRRRFIEGGKSGLRGRGDPGKAAERERDRLKRIIGELTIANDILKKPWRKAEVEGRQSDPREDEPVQVSGTCGDIPVHVVPYPDTKERAAGS